MDEPEVTPEPEQPITEEPTTGTPRSPLPGKPGGSGPISGPTAGPTIPGSGRGPGTASGKIAAARDVFWEAWWEHNKERLLTRRPVATISPAPVAKTPPKTMEDVRSADLLPVLRRLAADEHCGLRATAILSLGRVGTGSDLTVVVRGLTDVCPEVRQAACLALGQLSAPSSGIRLLRIFQDTNEAPRVRAMAAAGLAMVNGAEATPELIRVLSDRANSQPVRAGAAMALGFSDDSAASTALLAVAKDCRGELQLRSLALQALGRRSRLSSAGAIVSLLGDEAVEIRRAAVLALGAIRYQSDAAISMAAAIDRQIAWQESGALSHDAAKSLDESIRELKAQADKEHRRVEAVRTKTVHALLKLVDRDPDLQTRSFALISLGESDAREALPTVGRILDRSRHPLKAWAALTAGLLDEKALLPVVRRAFLDPGETDEVRGASAIALGMLMDRESADPLRTLVGNKGAGPDLRGHALTALAMMGSPEALRLGKRLLEKRSTPALRRSAALALGLVGQQDAASRLGQVLFTDSSPDVRSAAALALGYLRDPAVAEELARVAATDQTEFRIRVHAIAALGYLGSGTEGPTAMARFAWHYDYRNHLVALSRLTSLL